MKVICLPLLVFCLSDFLAPAQTNEPALRLTGIISLPDFRRALLESARPPRGEGLVTMGEGERQGRIEVLVINDQQGSTEIIDGGKKATLRVGGPTAVSTAEIAGSNLHLSDASLEQVLDVYSGICGRTVLEHPALKRTPISLTASVTTKSEAATALEEVLQRQGVTVIPEGKKFVLLVPASLTNGATSIVRDAAARIAPGTSSDPGEQFPPGTIHWQAADLHQALAIYGEFIGRKLVREEIRLPSRTIRLRTSTPLTRPEIIFAIETVLAWNDVKTVLLDDKFFKAVPTL